MLVSNHLAHGKAVFSVSLRALRGCSKISIGFFVQTTKAVLPG